MTKNILVIVGSSSVGGSTDILADSFIKGAVDNGNAVKKAHLGKMKVNPCLHCNQCFLRGAPCVQEDGMQEIYPAFREADTIVFASPVYFFSLSAQMKALIDRLYAFGFSEGFRLPPKECVLLATAADGHDDTFALTEALYERVFVAFLGWKDAGRVLAGGIIDRDEIENEPFLEDARRLGASL